MAKTAENKITMRDLQKEIAEEIIKRLEKDGLKGLQHWYDYGLPENGIRGRRYRGYNSLNLARVASMKGYTDNRWYTFVQVNKLNAKIKKGEKGTKIIYADQGMKDSDELDENGNNKKVAYKFHKSYVVFNAQQIDGIEPLITIKSEWSDHERAENLINCIGVPIHYDQNGRAFYIQIGRAHV